MKKTMSIILASVAMFAAIPLSTFAATYQYVNTSGNLQTVVADNSTQALFVPTNIDPHSGVMLVSGSGVIVDYPTPTQGNIYGYINTSGVMNTVVAANSTQALNTPTNIGIHSGVMLLSVNR